MRSINCRGNIITFDKPKIMGVVNLTPDSFFEGSRKQTIDAVVQSVEKMLQEGADIIDLGGFSTRPGAGEVDEKTEIDRLVPVVRELNKRFSKIVMSADTFRYTVGRAVLDEGVSIINDISFGAEGRLIGLCADEKVPYVLMHMRGTPTDIMKNAAYGSVTAEVFRELQMKTEQLLREGLVDVIIDPGFGFSKTLEQNFELLNGLELLKKLNRPLFVGVSRKTMIHKLLQTNADQALNGTTVVNTIALLKGADILRVHDVKEAVEAREIVLKLQSFNQTDKRMSL